MDPPYYKASWYDNNLELQDFIEMASVLAKIKVRFILSINDHPEMRKTFHQFYIDPAKLKYMVGKDNSKVGKELLVTNY